MRSAGSEFARAAALQDRPQLIDLPLQLRQRAVIGQNIVARARSSARRNLLRQPPSCLRFELARCSRSVGRSPASAAGDKSCNLHLFGCGHEDDPIEAALPTPAVGVCGRRYAFCLKDQCGFHDHHRARILLKDRLAQLRLPRNHRWMHDRVQLLDAPVGKRNPAPARCGPALHRAARHPGRSARRSPRRPAAPAPSARARSRPTAARARRARRNNLAAVDFPLPSPPVRPTRSMALLLSPWRCRAATSPPSPYSASASRSSARPRRREPACTLRHSQTPRDGCPPPRPIRAWQMSLRALHRRERTLSTSSASVIAIDPDIDQRRSRFHHLCGHKSRPADRRHQNVSRPRELRAGPPSCCGRPSPSPSWFSSIIAAGLPTMSDRPTTTAFCPATGRSLRRRISMIPAGVQGASPGWPLCSRPDIHRMEPIDILVRRHRLQQPLRVDVLRQRQLNQNAVDVVARIQLRHQRQHLIGRDALGRRQHLAVDAEFAAGLHLAANINLRGRHLAHQNHRQPGSDSTRSSVQPRLRPRP